MNRYIKWGKLITVFIFLIPYCVNSKSISQNNTITEYEISIHKTNPYKILVKATFSHSIDTLFIHPACPNYDYPKGWSTFIKPINKDLKYLKENKWIANSAQINYEVDLSFVKKNWDVGNEQSGKFINNSMFVVTRALFLTPKEGEKYKVIFKTPKDFRISTPWESSTNNTFLIHSKASLTNNTLVWGTTHIEKKINRKNFTLNVVLLDSNMIGKPKMIDDIFSKVLNEYLKIFPNTPKSNYLITAFKANQNDGESYTSSNAFTLKNELSDQNIPVWANQFSHELFHFWNGRMLNGPQRQKRQWFSEGYTEYFSNLVLVRSGIISKDDFYRIIEKSIGLYYYFKEKQYPDVSLLNSGFKKSKYRFGVYNGGWNAAFIMDMLIRSKSNKKTLGSFMNVLFEKYGLTKKEYVYEDLVNEFAKYIGNESKLFFENYISGTDTLPVEEYFKQLGLKIDYTSYESTTYIYDTIKLGKEKPLKRVNWLKKH